MKFKITTAHMIDYACAEVIGKAGRHNAEYVVYFSWQGTITGGYRFCPPDEKYLAVDAAPNQEALPAIVKDAALRVFEKRMDKDSPKFVLSRTIKPESS